MDLPFYQVDSFTSKVFGGNPAAVCPLSSWPEDDVLRNIAAENNLSETAFLILGDEQSELRWFTPVDEVDLCGHATLAAAYIAFSELGHPKNEIEFNTRSGVLMVSKNEAGFTMDFPVWNLEPQRTPDIICDALSPRPKEFYIGHDAIAVFESADEVRSLEPDMLKLSRYKGARGIIATAPGDDGYDFVSRAFFPRLGIPEDPVTGSAHCALVPYWAEQLGKKELRAYQASRRGGDILCRIEGERIHLTGQAVLYARGEIYV